MPDERPPDEAETEIRVEREHGWVHPHEPPLPDDPLSGPVAPPRVHEEERVVTDARGRTLRVVERTEEPPRRRRPNLVPALLIVLGLAVGVLAVAWYLTREDAAAVPSVTGSTAEEAVSRVEAEGFVAAVENRPDDAPDGTVIDQDPQGGVEADEGSTVRIVVSSGPETRPLPNAVGLDETAARDRLAAAGYEVEVTEVFSDERPRGTVVSQDSPAGRQVPVGETVRLEVSKGPEFVQLPSLVGRSADSAEAQLEQLGLQANVVEVPSREPAGTVVAQHPGPGRVRVGSTVRLNASKGA
jgi:serine/threonine-protein kinase